MGKIIRGGKQQKKSILDNDIKVASPTYEEEMWGSKQGQAVVNPMDAIIKSYLPELYPDKKPEQSPLSFAKPNDPYAGLQLLQTAEQADATQTKGIGSEFMNALDEATDDYKNLPLYDESSKHGKPIQISSQTQYQDIQKERLRQNILTPLKQEGGVGKDVSKNELQEIVGMTGIARWMNWLGAGDMVDQLPTNIQFKDNNIYYKDVKLNLDDKEKSLIGEFFSERSTYHGEDDSFLKKAAMFTASMGLDMPLYFAGGAAAGMIGKSIPFISEAMSINSIAGKFVSMGTNQAMMFNMINMPTTVQAGKDGGVGAVAKEIFHNALFGYTASLFGVVGLGTSRFARNAIFTNSTSKLGGLLHKFPQITDQLSTVFTSAGLGYTMASDMNGDNNVSTEERLVTALSFAALHFSSPDAFKSFAKEYKNKSIMLDKPTMDELNKLMQKGYSLAEAMKEAGVSESNYYELEKGQLHRIDANELTTNGKIMRTEDVNPIKYDKTNSANFSYINEVEPAFHRTIRASIDIQALEKLSKELYGRFTADMPPLYVQEHSQELKQLAWTTANQLRVGEVVKGFRKNKLPDDATLENKMIDVNNNWHLPYQDVKRYVAQNIGEFLTDPIAFKRNMFVQQGGSLLPDLMSKKYYDDLYNAVKTGADAVAKASQTKLLTEHKTQLLQPSTAPTEGRTYYDHNGELIPVDVMPNGKVKMGNTEFTPKPEKILTEKQAKAKLTGEAIEKPVKGDTVTWESDGKEWTGEVTAIEDTGAMVKRNDGKVVGINTTMIKSVKKAELPKVTTTEKVNEVKVDTVADLEKQLAESQAKDEAVIKTIPENIASIASFDDSKYAAEYGDNYLLRALNNRAFGNVVESNTTKELRAKLKEAKSKSQPIEKLTTEVPLKSTNVPEGDISIGESTVTPPSATVVTSEQIPTSEAIIPTKVEDAVNAIDKVKTSTGKSYEDAKTEVDKISEQLNKRLPSKSKEVTQQKLDDAKRDTKVLLLDAADVKLPRIAAVMDSDVKSVRNILRKYKNGVDNYSESANKILKDAGIKDYIEQVKAEKAKVSTDVKNEQLLNAEGLSKPTVVSEDVSPEIQDVINTSQETPWLTPDKIAKEKFRTSQDESILPEQYVAQRTPEEMKLSKGEKIREAGKANVKLNETEVAKAVFDSLTDANGNPLALTNENIDNAVQILDLTPQEGALLRKSIDEQKLPPEDLTKDKKLKVTIAVSNNMGKGLTLGQAIDETAKNGKITEREAEAFKASYPKERLGELYNTTNFADQPVDKAEFDAGLAKMLPGVKLKVVHDAVIDQTGVEPGKVRTGYTKILPDRTVEIGLATLTGKDAPLEETVHAGLLLASGGDGKAVDKFLKHLGSDGVEGSESWVNAHETLREQLVEFSKGYRPDEYGMLSKVKEVWEKLKNFFTGHGMYSSAEIYRKLLDGNMTFGEIARGMEINRPSVPTALMNPNSLGLFGGEGGAGFNEKAVKGQIFRNIWDNKLRYEIDDSQAKLHENWEHLPIDHPMDLKSVMYHPKFYQDYDSQNIGKELPKIVRTEQMIKSMRGEKNWGEFDEASNTMFINSGLGAEHALSAILHETQHWIQWQEGFARGGSADVFKNITQTQRNAFIKTYLDKLLPGLESDLNWSKNNVDNENLGKRDRKFIAKEIATITKQIEAIKDKTVDLNMLKALDMDYQFYRTIAGEVEANDVQARQNLTSAERLKINAYDSQRGRYGSLKKNVATVILNNTADIPPYATRKSMTDNPEITEYDKELLDKADRDEFSSYQEPIPDAIRVENRAEAKRWWGNQSTYVKDMLNNAVGKSSQVLGKMLDIMQRGGTDGRVAEQVLKLINYANARAMRPAVVADNFIRTLEAEINKTFTPKEIQDLEVLQRYFSEEPDGLVGRTVLPKFIDDMNKVNGGLIKWNDGQGRPLEVELNKVSEKVWDKLYQYGEIEQNKLELATEKDKELAFRNDATPIEVMRLGNELDQIPNISEQTKADIKGANYRARVNPYVKASEVITKMPEQLKDFFGDKVMTLSEIKKLAVGNGLKHIYTLKSINGEVVNEKQFNKDRASLRKQIVDFQNELKLTNDKKRIAEYLERSVVRDNGEVDNTKLEAKKEFSLGRMTYEDLVNEIMVRRESPDKMDREYGDYINYLAKKNGSYHYQKSYIPNSLNTGKWVERLRIPYTLKDGITTAPKTIHRIHFESAKEAEEAINTILANKDGFLTMLKRKGLVDDKQVEELRQSLSAKSFDTYHISKETDYLNDPGLRGLSFYEWHRLLGHIQENIKDPQMIEAIDNEINRGRINARFEKRSGAAAGSEKLRDTFQSFMDLNSEFARRNANAESQIDLANLMTEYGDKIDPRNRDYMQEVIKESLRSVRAENGLISAIRTGSYLNIMFSLKQIVMNATGIMSTGLPVLAKFHHARALPELLDNYKQGYRMLKAYGLDKAGKADLMNLSAEDALMYPIAKTMIENGEVNPQLLEEQMTGMTQGERGLYKTSQKWMGIGNVQVEKQNRMTALLAGYKIGLRKAEISAKKGETSADDVQSEAMRFAQIINANINVVPGLNTPLALQKSRGVLRTLLRNQYMLKSFTHNYMHIYSQSLRYGVMEGLKGSDKFDKGQLWAFAYANIPMLMMAGLGGLPFSSDMQNIVRSIFKKDTELEMRKFMSTLPGVMGTPEFADMVNNGMFTLGGVDVSKSLGMGDVLAQTGLGEGIDAITGSNAFKSQRNNILGGLGAGVDIPVSLVKSFADIAKGDWQALIDTPPLQTNAMIRYLTTAAKQSQLGVQNNRGETLVKPEDLSAYNIGMQALGFNSVKSTNAKEAKTAMDMISGDRSSAVRAFGEKMQDVLNDSYKGDSSTKMELIKAIKEWNNDNAEYGKPIMIRNIILSAINKIKNDKKALKEKGGSRYMKYLMSLYNVN